MVHSTKGIVACSQPLAASAGIKILELGGNSIDASIAVAACLCVLEPASTGVGGDCFLLHYDGETHKISGMNGTGRSPSALSIEFLRKQLGNEEDLPLRLSANSVHSVTVPGGVAGWIDAFETLGSGKVTLAQVLDAAISLCEDGHPISEISASLSQQCWKRLQKQNSKQVDLLQCFASVEDSQVAPKEGDLVVNRPLGSVFRLLAEKGKKGFYEGEVARAIVDEVQSRGGALSLDDLAQHQTTFVEPINLEFLGHKMWEIPPNSQGLVVLIALGIIRELDEDGKICLRDLKQNSTEYLHLLIECLKIAFYDADEYVSDPQYQQADILPRLLSKSYLKSRARFFRKDGIIDSSKMKHGVPDATLNQADTVYFTVSDPQGNATSFINSVYMGFGSAIIPAKFGGFCLQNRGANFNLTPGSKNSLEPNKRPYHTIIPAMITDAVSGELVYSLGNMGGFMQPTGHLQHFLNLILFKLSPQESLDAPRICLSPHPKYADKDRGLGSDGPVSTPVTLVSIEEDMPSDVIEGLRALGHDVEVISGSGRSLFGRGQIIKKSSSEKSSTLLYSAGSDKRGDGCAIPMI